MWPEHTVVKSAGLVGEKRFAPSLIPLYKIVVNVQTEGYPHHAGRDEPRSPFTFHDC
jgi:hypothetical protein